MAEVKARGCGECTACCFTHSVGPVKPDLFKACAHCRPGPEAGCAIYGEHPIGCRKYRCWWLLTPSAPDEMRPDRFGIVMDTHADSRLPLTLLMLWQFLPGRLRSPGGQQFIDAMLATGNYIVLCMYGDRDLEFFFPASIPDDERGSCVVHVTRMITGKTVKID